MLEPDFLVSVHNFLVLICINIIDSPTTFSFSLCVYVWLGSWVSFLARQFQFETTLLPHPDDLILSWPEPLLDIIDGVAAHQVVLL